jgi:hypothetical protein
MSNFLSYFNNIVDHPFRTEVDLLPIGDLWCYVGSNFLDGIVNWTRPIKAYILDRYHSSDEVFEDTVLHKPTTKNKAFQRLTAPGNKVPYLSFGQFGDDVVLLARGRWEKTRDLYYYFYFDLDSSGCQAGRFSTVDGNNEVIENFRDYFLVECACSAREIPYRVLDNLIHMES